MFPRIGPNYIDYDGISIVQMSLFVVYFVDNRKKIL